MSAKPAIPKKTAKSSKATRAKKSALPTTTPAAEPLAPQKSLVQTLIEQLERGELSSRSEAAAKLGSMGDNAAVPALVQALRDPTAEVAREAALALGAIKDFSALPHLAEAVLNRDGYFHSLTRIAAAESLGRLRDTRAVESLITGARDPIADASCAAVTALGEIGDPTAVPTLINVVENLNGYYLFSVRQAAVSALVKLESEAARTFLNQFAGNEFADPALRNLARMV